MGQLEPDKTTISKEVNHWCSVARSYPGSGKRSAPYPHQLDTAGNLAWPFTPCDIPMGPLSEYHIMRVQNLLELFPVKAQTLLGGASHEPSKGWFYSFFAIFGDWLWQRQMGFKEVRSKAYFLHRSQQLGHAI